MGPKRPDDFAAEVEVRDRVGDAMRQLPEEHRDVIRLTVFEGMTQKDAAAELDIDRKTVRKRWDQALEMLRGILTYTPWSRGSTATSDG